jgi:signal transduction histidine kinase
MEDPSVNEMIEKYISLQLSVIDTGIGMTEEGINNLFIDFGRLKENEHRNKSGTGLGLSICKQIIEKMGGSVHVSSQLKIGSRFDININTKCRVLRS